MIQNYKRKWYYYTEYVDIDTGEMIPKWLKEQKYRIINSEVQEEHHQTHSIRTYLRICKEKEQLKLEL